MSRVLMNRVFAKDSYQVDSTFLATGWRAGQFLALNTIGQLVLAVTDTALFMSGDQPADTTNTGIFLAAPPTGSIATVIYGIGSKVFIDHSAEVAAADATRAYNATCESAAIGADLYVDASGKLTSSVTGSVKAKLIQVPTANNNYTIGVLLRI